MKSALFNGLKNLVDSALSPEKEQVAQASIFEKSLPVPEVAINGALAFYAKDLEGIEQLAVNVHEGYFEVAASGKKIIPFMARTRFDITECIVSKDVQCIKLRQIGKTDVDTTGLLSNIVLAIVKAIVFSAAGIDPAKQLLAGQPGIEVSDDLYVIDLSQTTLSRYLDNNPVLGFMRVTGAVCADKAIKIRLAI